MSNIDKIKPGDFVSWDHGFYVRGNDINEFGDPKMKEIDYQKYGTVLAIVDDSALCVFYNKKDNDKSSKENIFIDEIHTGFVSLDRLTKFEREKEINIVKSSDFSFKIGDIVEFSGKDPLLVHYNEKYLHCLYGTITKEASKETGMVTINSPSGTFQLLPKDVKKSNAIMLEEFTKDIDLLKYRFSQDMNKPKSESKSQENKAGMSM